MRYRCFISGIVNPIINSVKFSFWVSVHYVGNMHTHVQLKDSEQISRNSSGSQYAIKMDSLCLSCHCFSSMWSTYFDNEVHEAFVIITRDRCVWSNHQLTVYPCWEIYMLSCNHITIVVVNVYNFLCCVWFVLTYCNYLVWVYFVIVNLCAFYQISARFQSNIYNESTLNVAYFLHNQTSNTTLFARNYRIQKKPTSEFCHCKQLIHVLIKA